MKLYETDKQYKVISVFKPGPLFEYFAKESPLPSLKHRHRFIFKLTTFLSLPSRNNSDQSFTLSPDLIDYGIDELPEPRRSYLHESTLVYL